MYLVEDGMDPTNNDGDEGIPKDTLGRRVTPRRFRTVEERRRIVEETMVPGASVAGVARRHEVNANQVFVWRKLYQQGLLESGAEESSNPEPAGEAPTPISAGTLKRVSRGRGQRAVEGTPEDTSGDFVELELASGIRIRVYGKAATQLLERLIGALGRQ